MIFREPGYQVAIDDVLEPFRSADFRDDVLAHFTYREVEPLAYLAFYTGTADNKRLAQEILRDWANLDEDAELDEEIVAELADYGITHGSAGGSAPSWDITGPIS